MTLTPQKWPFKIAGSMGVRLVLKKAGPVILEPIMNLEVVTPEEFMGDIIGDLSARRGRVESMDDRFGAKVIKAFVPLAELFGYTTDIRSMTQGRAASTMELDHYADVPKQRRRSHHRQKRQSKLYRSYPALVNKC